MSSDSNIFNFRTKKSYNKNQKKGGGGDEKIWLTGIACPTFLVLHLLIIIPFST